MYRRRKKYYQKTIVLKGAIFKGTIYTLIVAFIVSFLYLVAGFFNVAPSKAYILSEFTYFFSVETHSWLKEKTVYDTISSVIPSVKSSAEMTKKYAAKYGGVKKNKTVDEAERSDVDNVKIKSMDMSAKGITFRNETAYIPDVESLLKKELAFSADSTISSVLIMHTHTSEAYAESSGARSTDNTQNVVRVGEVLKNQLEKHGIGVIHDTTQNDYPAYNGSYTKALSGITAAIEQYPDIQVVLDVHRDYAEQNQDGQAVQLKPVTEFEGKSVAQMMFVVGTDGLGLYHPEWKQNLAFAVQIQAELNKVCQSIARPINIRRERFNQHMTKGSLILEMGTAGNTLKECENAAVYVADAIAKVMKK